MTAWERWIVHLANLAVGGTGVVYAVMVHLVEPADEWAVVNHPWQPHVQHLHVLVAPLLVFAVGLLWRGHVVARLRNGSRRRPSGLSLLGLFVPMTASGYLLQVAVDPWWRSVWAWLHLATGVLWLASFAAHALLGRRRAEEAAGRPADRQAAAGPRPGSVAADVDPAA